MSQDQCLGSISCHEQGCLRGEHSCLCLKHDLIGNFSRWAKKEIKAEGADQKTVVVCYRLTEVSNESHAFLNGLKNWF